MSNTKHTKEQLPPGQVWAEIKPKHWYEWGDEGTGVVSTFAYDKWGDYHFTGKMEKQKAIDLGLTFHNPHN